MKARRFRRLKLVAAAVGILAAVVYLNNTSWLADPIGTRPILVAHRLARPHRSRCPRALAPGQSDRTAWLTRAAGVFVLNGSSPSNTANRSSTAVYQTGSAISVKTVEEIRPPIIAAAMDWM